jgi:hypothetical protein
LRNPSRRVESVALVAYRVGDTPQAPLLCGQRYRLPWQVVGRLRRGDRRYR